MEIHLSRSWASRVLLYYLYDWMLDIIITPSFIIINYFPIPFHSTSPHPTPFHIIQSVQISPDGSRSFHMFPDDHVELLSGEGHSFATQHLTTIPDCVPSRVATCPTLHCLGGRVQSVAEPRVRSSVQSSRRLPFVGLVYLI